MNVNIFKCKHFGIELWEMAWKNGCIFSLFLKLWFGLRAVWLYSAQKWPKLRAEKKRMPTTFCAIWLPQAWRLVILSMSRLILILFRASKKQFIIVALKFLLYLLSVLWVCYEFLMTAASKKYINVGYRFLRKLNLSVQLCYRSFPLKVEHLMEGFISLLMPGGGYSRGTPIYPIGRLQSLRI